MGGASSKITAMESKPIVKDDDDSSSDSEWNMSTCSDSTSSCSSLIPWDYTSHEIAQSDGEDLVEMAFDDTTEGEEEDDDEETSQEKQEKQILGFCTFCEMPWRLSDFLSNLEDYCQENGPKAALWSSWPQHHVHVTRPLHYWILQHLNSQEMNFSHQIQLICVSCQHNNWTVEYPLQGNDRFTPLVVPGQKIKMGNEQGVCVAYDADTQNVVVQCGKEKSLRRLQDILCMVVQTGSNPLPQPSMIEGTF